MIDLSPDHLKAVRRILAEHVPDCEVRAFGSRVTWTAKEYSDLDLAVVGERRLDMDTLRLLREAFEESDLPFRVDVLDWRAISESFQKVIEANHELIQRGKMKRGSGGGGEWKLERVSRLIEDGILYIGDGYRAKNEELIASGGLPFARAKNVNNGFHFDDADHFPVKDLHRVGSKASIPGDVVFTSKGTVGRFAFVSPGAPRFVYSPQLCYWRSLDPATIAPRFLYYWMSGHEFHVQFKGVASQTDMAEYVSLADQRRMHITLPPAATQRAIAHILGTLDDKIELNRRMNETLEAMARALFKSWFVDFDPVRAKMEGQDTGLPEHISRLFPGRLEESKLGDIPKGWSVKTIRELAEIVGGSTPRTAESAYWCGGVHRWATPKDLSSLTSPILLETERYITEAGLRQIGSGLLPAGTVLLSSRAPIGYSAITEIPTAINQGFIGMKPRKGIPSIFLLIWTHFSSREILSYANGSTFLEISKSNFRRIAIVTAPLPVFESFEIITRPLYRKLVVNEQYSRTLAAIRDALLPKLISGELRVKDAERFVEKVV